MEHLGDKLPSNHIELMSYLLRNNEGIEQVKIPPIGEIRGRLEKIAARFLDGFLLIPRKRVVGVAFDPVFSFRYRQGYQDETVRRVYNLLLDGAGSTAVSRITGVNTSTIREWARPILSSKVGASRIYPRISLFCERRLREAAERRMNLKDTSMYAGTNTSFVRGFWMKIGYNYLAPEQEEKILEGIKIGANRNQIARYAGITRQELSFFISLKGFELNVHNPPNLSSLLVEARPRKFPHKKYPLIDDVVRHIQTLEVCYGKPVTFQQLLEAIPLVNRDTLKKRLKDAYATGLIDRVKNGAKWLYTSY